MGPSALPTVPVPPPSTLPCDGSTPTSPSVAAPSARDGDPDSPHCPSPLVPSKGSSPTVASEGTAQPPPSTLPCDGSTPASPSNHALAAPSARDSDSAPSKGSSPTVASMGTVHGVRMKQYDDQPKPGMVHAFDGLVAALTSDSDKVITTPNMTWVPRFADPDAEIMAHTDGRWGLYEYSRWPQAFSRDFWHLHCIPAHPRSLRPGPVCFRTLSCSDWKEAHGGIPNLGNLEPLLQEELLDEARLAITRYERQDPGEGGWVLTGYHLLVFLRHFMDRLRFIPAEDITVVRVAAHIQRLVLELYGLIEWLSIVRERIRTKNDHRSDILDIVGAHTSVPYVALFLHRAGVPVWFEQRTTRCGEPVEVYKLVEASDIPSDFSRTPSTAPLVLPGASNGLREWVHAMSALTRCLLCRSKLPVLLDAEAQSILYSAKRPRAPKSRRAKARAAKHAAAESSHRYKCEPFRQFYPSQNVLVSDIWAAALTRASPTPQQRIPAQYYFPPPWLFDDLTGFSTTVEKRGRYLHHWVSIRTYCRTRLFASCIDGGPLTVPEWRHVVWGHYEVNAAAESTDDQGKSKYLHDLLITVRRLFGKVAALPSYSVDAQHNFGNTAVTAKTAEDDRTLRRRVVYDIYETNWRCELLALDELMMESGDWEGMSRLKRESLVSRVWGGGTSGIDIMPAVDDPTPSRWRLPPESGWEECRPHHIAFVVLMNGWSHCPPILRGAADVLPICGQEEYACIMRAAVNFYVQVFVEAYGRLPVPPVYIPADFDDN